MSGIELFLDDHRGVYIPRDFVESIDLSMWEGISAEDADTLRAGPDHEWYWETWDDVMSNAVCTDKNGKKWMLYQDGALWVYCEDLMTLEEKHNFGFDIDTELCDILEANPEFEINGHVVGSGDSLGQNNYFDKHYTWTGPEGVSKKGFSRWTDAALDCVQQNDLSLPAEDVQTLPLF